MYAREFFTDGEIVESVDGFEIIAINGKFYVNGVLCFTFEEAEDVLVDMRAEKAESERIWER